MLLIIILFLIVYLSTVSCAPSMIKAGVDKTKTLIPFVNTYELIKIIGRPSYQAFVIYLPIFNFFLLFSVFTDLSKCFGRNSFKDYFKAMVIPFIFFKQIAKTDKYLGTVESLTPTPKSGIREWSDSILFAVLAATLIRWSTFEAFTIPTSSMEGTLMVGDYLFVSKLHYGPRSPITPLQVPLTHQNLWFTDKTGDGTTGTPSYVDWIQLPYFRFPGITEIKRNDIVVFNWPWDNGKDVFPDLGNINRKLLRPTDLKTNYVKRCVAIPGDTLEIREQILMINGKPSTFDGVIQHSYLVSVDKKFFDKQYGKFSPNNLNDYAVSLCDEYKIRVESMRDQNGYVMRAVRIPSEYDFYVNMSAEKAKTLKALPFISNVEVSYVKKGDFEFRAGENLYPVEKNSNLDNYGPIVMPKKGMTIPITKENLIMFERALLYFEGDGIEYRDNGSKLFVNGSEVKEYTFKQNYYYMIGDNRHGSYDSRTWGFVPESHIVGTPLMVWMSIEDTAGKDLLDRIRWERIFKWVR
jgi:signal peptidase I